MSNKDNGGSAFPTAKVTINGVDVLDGIEAYTTGISMRDYFAAKALMGMLANQRPYQVGDEHMFAHDAYVLADAMLEARKQ